MDSTTPTIQHHHPDGAIELAGKRYTSPSAAGRALRKRATNGWYFWSVADGRRLRDVRTQFQNSTPEDEESKPGNA